ncbi:SDR family NAD(P)-dependent oxidoreductase [Nonomuraea sp. NPDC052129]|uniref:SDR family NAD(P)-dependent oxidoreductase n=1 Tax=Nonomuraea sp. NPDC052129 TaxID=3154651 RepID=UPI003439386C
MTNSRQTSVLITGGNKGLGFEAARRLAELGWTIFLGSRDEGHGQAAAGKLADGGSNVVMVPLDVTSDESVSQAVRLVPEHTDRHGHPRVVMVSSAVGAFSVVTDPEQPSSKFHELAYSSSKAALNMITVRYAQALPEIKFNLATPRRGRQPHLRRDRMNHNTA